METETLIVGGGLCGLSLAAQLHGLGRDFHLIEARDRVGGRVLSETVDGEQFDLGPAWFWPGQPRIETLVSRYELTRFEQYAKGALSFEDEAGRVERGRGFASMEGSLRFEGGMAALTDALATSIPSRRLHLADPVTLLKRTGPGVAVTTQSGATFRARRVVLALPPRLVAQVKFAPALPDKTTNILGGVSTWMAGQAKAVAVYERPFWREAGLSGDAMSRRGPMVEIHDASPIGQRAFGLFGFIGVPPTSRQSESALRQAVIAQLVRLFGPNAATPRDVLIKDWASDPHTAVPRDHEPMYAHPQYGLPAALSQFWEDRVILSGTETAPTFGGYLEGALEAAENALRIVEQESV